MDTENNQAQPNNNEGNAEQAKEVSTNPELGIKKVRTFAEDLAEAKARAGVKDTEHKEGPKKEEKVEEEKTNEPSEALKEARKDFESHAAAPELHKEESEELPEPEPQKEVTPAFAPKEQPSREFIEEQLAKSGIVTTHKIEEDKKKKTSTPAIQTFKNDVADEIKEKNISAVDIVAAEQNKRRSQPKVAKQSFNFATAARNLGIVLFSIGLIGSGVWVIAHFYNQARVAEVNQPAQNPERDVIATNATESLTIGDESGRNLMELLLAKENIAPTSDTDIIEITLNDLGIFGEQRITATKLLDQMNAPEVLERNVGSQFIFGYHGGVAPQPFFIFAIEDFDSTFRGMLDWESTISSDMDPLFGDSQKGLFKDVFVRNKDTRSLIDESGNTRLLYAFPNTSSLVITTNEDTFFEIFARMQASNRSSN